MKKILLILIIANLANAQDLPSGIFTGSRQRGAGTLDEQYNFYMSLPSTSNQERDQATFKYNMYKEAERNQAPRPKPRHPYDASVQLEREIQRQLNDIYNSDSIGE